MIKQEGVLTSLRKIYKSWFTRAKKRGLFSELGLDEQRLRGYNDLLYPLSVQRIGDAVLYMIHHDGKRALAVFNRDSLGFSGHLLSSGEDHVWLCPLSHGNAVQLRKTVDHTGPSTLKGRAATFGVGDRLGIATPGHIRILRQFAVSPVFAQQSPRELELAGRSYSDIVDPATWAVFQEGYVGPWGADGDHLKSVEWVREAQSFGCTMITADLTDHIQTGVGKLGGDALYKEYEKLEPAYRKEIEGEYLGRNVKLDTGECIAFNRERLAQISMTYNQAVMHAQKLYRAGAEYGGELDFEVSIDETDSPTSPEAHVFVARELQKLNIPVVSLAPRFIGKFEKAVDYEGDFDALRRSFATHRESIRAEKSRENWRCPRGSCQFCSLLLTVDTASDNLVSCGWLSFVSDWWVSRWRWERRPKVAGFPGRGAPTSRSPEADTISLGDTAP